MEISLDDIKRNAQIHMSGNSVPISMTKMKKQLDQPLDVNRLDPKKQIGYQKPRQKPPQMVKKIISSKNTIEGENKMNIRKKQPKILSKEAMKILNSDKHTIIGAHFCGHCRNTNNLIDGKFRVLSVVQNGKEIGIKYTWENYKDSLKQTEKTSKKIDQLYKDKKLSTKDYHALKTDAEHLISVNKAILDPSIHYDDIRKNYKIFYTDDIEPEQEKMANKIIKQAFKKNISLDDIYKQLDNIQDGKKIKNYIIGQEIMRAYRINTYPTRISDTCEIKKDSKGNINLDHCKESGFIEGYAFLEYDATQRKDTKLLQTIQDVKKKYDKSTLDIQDLLSKIKR